MYYGFDPTFSDLRSAGAEVLQLTHLTFEPGEEGSYVLPARLDASPAEVVELNNPRRVSAEDVVVRFAEILAGAGDEKEADRVSLGALRALDRLGTLLQEEGSRIEYQAEDTKGRLLPPRVVDRGYLERVRKARESRTHARTLRESLDGTITAIDLDKDTLVLRLDGTSRRVKGTFSRLLHPPVVAALGRRVRFHGQVTRRGDAVRSIVVEQVEPDVRP